MPLFPKKMTERTFQEYIDKVCGVIQRNMRQGISLEGLYHMKLKGIDRPRLEDICRRLVDAGSVELYKGRYYPPDPRGIPRENQQQQRTPDSEGSGPGAFNIRQYHIYPQPPNHSSDPYQQQSYDSNARLQNSVLQPSESEQESGDDDNDNEPEDGGDYRPTY